MPSLLAGFLPFITSLYGQLTLFALALAIVAFFFAAKARSAIDVALGAGMHRKPLRLFDLSHGDAAEALRARRLVAPERLWTYDETYLERFAQAALHARMPRGSPALHYYVRAVLRGLDLWFAAGLGAFVILVDVALADALSTEYPFWARAAWIGACMGLVYLAADVAEDLKLASVLDRAATGGEDAVAAIDAGEAAAANMLTRVKLVAITLAAIAIRPPADPAPEGVPVRVGAD